MSDGLPQITLSKDEVIGMSVLDAFIKTELGASKGEVRRLIKGGGARVNGTSVQGDDAVLSEDDNDTATTEIYTLSLHDALLILF